MGGSVARSRESERKMDVEKANVTRVASLRFSGVQRSALIVHEGKKFSTR